MSPESWLVVVVYVAWVIPWRKLAKRTGVLVSKRKRNSDGIYRQAQADHRNPDPLAATRALTAQAYGAKPTKDTPEDARPRVTDDMPILAHRAAQLVERPGGARLVSMTAHGAELEVDMDALCASTEAWSKALIGGLSFSWPIPPAGKTTVETKAKIHTAPDWSCTCGFYAVPLADPLPYNTWHVDLLVELSGTVIEHETGYRAGHQRLVEARIPACGLCSLPTDGVRLGESPLGRCSRHMIDGAWLSRDDLARVLPVPVTYLGEDN